MHGYPGKTNQLLEDFIDERIRAEREDQWGEMDGEVVSFDPQTQTATVRPFYRKRLAGVPTQVADLQSVPIEFPRAGGGAMTAPVKVGDRVRLRPMMYDASAYDTDGVAFDAVSDRSFSLSDMRATVIGGDSVSSPIKNFDAQNHHLRFDEEGKFGIRGSPDGKVAIEGAQGNVYTLIATALRNLAGAKTIVNKGSSAGTYDHDQKAAVLAIADLLDRMAL